MLCPLFSKHNNLITTTRSHLTSLNKDKSIFFSQILVYASPIFHTTNTLFLSTNKTCFNPLTAKHFISRFHLQANMSLTPFTTIARNSCSKPDHMLVKYSPTKRKNALPSSDKTTMPHVPCFSTQHVLILSPHVPYSPSSFRPRVCVSISLTQVSYNHASPLFPHSYIFLLLTK